MAEKFDHSSVNYRDGTKTRRCEFCTMFRPPASCTDVKSPIRPDGVCDIFKRKAAED